MMMPTTKSCMLMAGVSCGGYRVKKLIKSIVQWNEAWQVHFVVMLSNPVLTSEQKAALGCELFQYMDYIDQLYVLQADWGYYDAFRSLRQYNNTPFSCFDPELKDEAISRAKKKDLAQKSQSVKSSSPAKPHFTHNVRPKFHRNNPSLAMLSEAKSKFLRYYIPSGCCHRFLAFLPCLGDTCPYQHTCPFCSAKHPVSPNYHHNGGPPYDHGTSCPQGSRDRGGPNNYCNWLPHL